jgi:hypothetical protein
MAKKLFVLVQDCGDGSFYPRYTFDTKWIHEMEMNSPKYDGEGSLGCDGDGFHYDILMVPDECTLESLGISSDAAEIYF